jgi:hypothetical protein
MIVSGFSTVIDEAHWTAARQHNDAVAGDEAEHGREKEILAPSGRAPPQQTYCALTKQTARSGEICAPDGGAFADYAEPMDDCFHVREQRRTGRDPAAPSLKRLAPIGGLALAFPLIFLFVGGALFALRLRGCGGGLRTKFVQHSPQGLDTDACLLGE